MPLIKEKSRLCSSADSKYGHHEYLLVRDYDRDGKYRAICHYCGKYATEN
jgi:homospermidine synthase